MQPFLFGSIKITLIVIVVILIVVGVVIWQYYPFGVTQYKVIILGMPAAEKPGDSTGWAPPEDRIPASDFYVYSLGDITMCIGSDCGMGGYFVECLGGWLSGYKDIGDVSDYGLRDAGVDINKQKVITIAGKNSRIVGIYPGASIRNLPYILSRHRDLVSEELFEACSDSLPWRWK